jgi:hypothetical protein
MDHMDANDYIQGGRLLPCEVAAADPCSIAEVWFLQNPYHEGEGGQLDRCVRSFTQILEIVWWLGCLFPSNLQLFFKIQNHESLNHETK